MKAHSILANNGQLEPERERARDDGSQLIRETNKNPILDTEYTANIIAESMVAQCNANGHDTKKTAMQVLMPSGTSTIVENSITESFHD